MGDLTRRGHVGEHLGPAGLESPGQRLEIRGPVPRPDLESLQRVAITEPRLKRRAGFGSRLRARFDGECRRGQHPVAVPEGVEDLRCVPGNRSDAQYVEIVKIEVLVESEILVPDVASTDDRGAVVSDQDLVVHALVEPLHLGNRFSGATRQPLPGPGVEQGQLDVRMRVQQRGAVIPQRDRGRIVQQRADVVDQQAHADTAIGGVQQSPGHQHARAVRIPEVVLQVDRASCRVDQREPPAQAILVGVQQLET